MSQRASRKLRKTRWFVTQQNVHYTPLSCKIKRRLFLILDTSSGLVAEVVLGRGTFSCPLLLPSSQGVRVMWCTCRLGGRCRGVSLLLLQPKNSSSQHWGPVYIVNCHVTSTRRDRHNSRINITSITTSHTA